MKKTLIALSVGFVVSGWTPLAQADIGGFGSVAAGLLFQDDDDDDLDLVSGDTYVGFEGTEDLGNGMLAVYHLEIALSSDQATLEDGDRTAFVALQGGFGTLSIGRQDAPFYELVVERIDTFEGVGNAAPLVAGANTAEDTDNGVLGPSIRASDTFKYSNDFGGLQVGLMLQMRDNTENGAGDDDDIDRIDLSFSGRSGALGWGLGYVTDAASQGDDSVVGIAVDYALGRDTTLLAAYVQMDNDEFTTGELPDGTDLAATTDGGTDNFAETSVSIGIVSRFGGGLQLQARYNDLSDVAGTLALGLAKDLSRRTTVFSEIEHLDPDSGDSTTTIALGIRHDF